MLNYRVLTKKITSNKTKHVLVEKELNKLKTFDSGYFIGKSQFEDGTQNYLVFQWIYIYIYIYIFQSFFYYTISWICFRMGI